MGIRNPYRGQSGKRNKWSPYISLEDSDKRSKDALKGQRDFARREIRFKQPASPTDDSIQKDATEAALQLKEERDG